MYHRRAISARDMSVLLLKLSIIDKESAEKLIDELTYEHLMWARLYIES